MTLEELVNKNHNQLNENDMYVLNFISQNMVLSSDKTVAEIALSSNVSSSTIIRMVQKLGFKGYSEFRYFLKSETQRIENTKVINHGYISSSVVLDDVKATIRLFEENKMTEKLYKHIRTSQKIYAYATGYGQELMLKEFARCLINVGIDLVIIPGKIELEIIAETITSDNLLFVISLSGNIQNQETILQKISMKNVPIISVTLFSRNPLAYLANYNLYYQVSNINPISHLNNSSFCTLILVLNLLYEGYINYLKKDTQEN